MNNKMPGGNWLRRTVSVLLGLVLLSSWQLAGVAARYSAADSGSDSARVARWTDGIWQEQTFSVELHQWDKTSTGTTASPVTAETITLCNDSEVALIAHITAQNTTNNLPLIFSWEADTASQGSQDTQATTLGASAAGEISQDVAMAPGETVDVALIVQLDNTAADDNNYHREIDRISVTVEYVQCD